MKNKIYTQFSFFAGFLLFLALTSIVAALLDYFLGTSLLLFVLLTGILLTCLLIYRMAQLLWKALSQKQKDVHQIESLLWLYQKMELPIGLPSMRDYAASPDLLKLILITIEQYQPRTIVEAGAGTSSVIIAQYLEQKGIQTHHIALDHLERFASKTKEKIQRPLTNIVHAPLQSYKIKEQSWQWYDLNALKEIKTIDLLIIDGPPQTIQKLARYPAVPLLINKLSENSIIILDDAKRPEDQQIIEQWAKILGFSYQLFDTEKGAGLLIKQ